MRLQRTILDRILQRLVTPARQINRLPCALHLDPPLIPLAQARRPARPARHWARPTYQAGRNEISLLGRAMAERRGSRCRAQPVRVGLRAFPVRQYPELTSNSEDLTKFPDLQKKYEAPTFQVISRVLKSLTGKKVTPPGSFRK